MTKSTDQKTILAEEYKRLNFLIEARGISRSHIHWTDGGASEDFTNPSAFTLSFHAPIYQANGLHESINKKFSVLQDPRIPSGELVCARLYRVIGETKYKYGLYHRIKRRLFPYKRKLLKLDLFSISPLLSIHYWSILSFYRRLNKIKLKKGIQDNPKNTTLTILNMVNVLLKEVFPLLVEFSIYGRALLLYGAKPSGVSIPNQLTEDLRQLSKSSPSLTIESFIERWGYRSIDDYELSEHSFYEDREAILKISNLYQNSEPLVDTQNNCKQNIVDFFLEYKEKIRDVGVRLYRELRPAMLLLGRQIDLHRPEDIFYCELNYLIDYSNNVITENTLRDKIADNKNRHLVLSNLKLPSKLSISDLEQLLIAGAKSGLQKEKIELRGRFLTIPKDFSGKVLKIASFNQAFTAMDDKYVIVTKNLSPKIVKFFRHAAGVVTEVGGHYSHAALVARELGIPMIRVGNIFDHLEDQDTISASVSGEIIIGHK